MIVYLFSIEFGANASKIGTHRLHGKLVPGFVSCYLSDYPPWPFQIRSKFFFKPVVTIFAVIRVT
jgi:hypothetical protein